MSSSSKDLATVTLAEEHTSFDRLTIALHWVTVFLVATQFASAWSTDHLDPSFASTMLSIHRSSGVLLWSLVMGRMLWRFTGMRKPPFPKSRTRFHAVGVQLSEYGLYALLLVQPLTGALDSVFRGRPFNLSFWVLPALVHRDRAYAALAHTAHEFGAYCLAALVIIHALAALAHHFVLKDQILARMLPKLRSADGCLINAKSTANEVAKSISRGQP